MKIVCESCGAKYSIADERVTGKVFKIRCKRCSSVIVVRGDQPGAAEAPAAAPAQSQDAIWHVVIDGEQAGPYSPGQLAEMLTSGSVDWDAYVWTEGFDNWAPMRDIAELVAQITGQAEPQAAPQAAPAYRATTQTLTGQPSMGADPFADDAPPSDAGLFGGGGGGGPDLFGRGAQPGAGEAPGVVSSSPSPRVGSERALTGARNENSVLFSLKNLQALATGSGTPSSPPVMQASQERAGFASGEGSGLIDIRALATTTGVSDSGAPSPGSGSGHKDDLLSIGSQGGAFGTLGSPMLSPVRDDGDGNKKTIIWAVVAGLGLVSAALVAAAYILRAPNPAPAAPSVGMLPQASAQPVAAAPVPPPAAAAAPAAAPSEGELAAKEAAAEHEKTREPTSGSSHGGEHRSSKHSGESSGAKASAEPGAAQESEKKAPPKSSGPRSIDDLLDGALSGSSSSKGAQKSDSEPAASNLPLTPTRDQVLSAMNGVKAAVQACSKGAGGVATVSVNVAGATGRVTTAEVNGVQGPAGSCIAQAVRKAQFAKFSQKVFKVTFPYKL
jgi:predicted Zn finger-like uncharacterized protein